MHSEYGEVFLFMDRSMDTKISFFKTAKTSYELLEQLKARGMIIDDENFALDVLSKVNYYRLSGYWFKFQNKWLKTTKTPDNLPPQEKEILDNKFVEIVSFSNIAEIYKFDTKLRSLCLDALEKIEIAIGSTICEHLCVSKGGYWFLDKQNICDVNKKQKDGTHKTLFSYEMLLNDFDEIMRRNERTKCIKNFRNKYSNKYPPYWILSQLITFGTLSKLYTSLQAQDKKEIAKKIGLNVDILEKSLQTLAYVRNICAHYARLWDNENSLIPVNIRFNATIANSKFNYNFHRQNNNLTFFPIFYLISFFLHNLYPASKWCTLIADKISEYQVRTQTCNNVALVSYKKMGFPDDWKQLPLFVDMLKNK